MNTVPIAFAFDNNLVMPACVCLSSLMMNAKPDTFYDIFILHSEKKPLERKDLDRLPEIYPRCRLTYVPVGDVFDNAFEIRGITTAAYYRLLIPELIPQYDKILYSDVDVIFRSDLSVFYEEDIAGYYYAGVLSDAGYNPDQRKYYHSMGLNPNKIFYDGNLIINSALIRSDGIMSRFMSLLKNKYRFQEMDIINIVAGSKIKTLDPSFCLTVDLNKMMLNDKTVAEVGWPKEMIDRALAFGIVHYNGNKPWKTWCVNFDIWWEYYRKSPFFDPEFYFDFFYKRIDEYDRLPLWKRIKILVRYFVFGRKK